MSEKPMSQCLPRRTLLVTAGLAALALPASARPPAEAPVDTSPPDAESPAEPGAVRLTIEAWGDAFSGVVAHFPMPDGETLPFYAWNGGAPTSFTMPLSEKGLRFTVTENQDFPLVLTTFGDHVWTSGKSQLRIAVSQE